MAPANGCAAPHSRFCTASASPNTSRPQPFSTDMGVRKKPSAERGPNDRTAIRQPQMMITAGVRQLMRKDADCMSRLAMGGGSGLLKFAIDAWIAQHDLVRDPLRSYSAPANT